MERKRGMLFMAQSAEWAAMQQALKITVVPELRAAGFRGSFPHFRRVSGEKVDLISFLSHSQWGGAFEVGASVIFLNAKRPEDSNRFFPDAPTPTGKLIWGDGRIRHGLPGTFDGAFGTLKAQANYTDGYGGLVLIQLQ